MLTDIYQEKLDYLVRLTFAMLLQLIRTRYRTNLIISQFSNLFISGGLYVWICSCKQARTQI